MFTAKVLLLVYLVVLCCSHVLANQHYTRKEKVFYSEEDAQTYFEKFVKTHNKTYLGKLEKATRFKVFKENLFKINELNKNDPNCTFAINEFTDLSEEEFIMKYTGFLSNLREDHTQGCRSVYDADLKKVKAPNAFDWRDRITMLVKNQKACGSCWAFAATANVEAQYAKKNKGRSPISLSEQQLMDCDTGSAGCRGGNPTQALRYLVQVGGQELERIYPYHHNKRSCKFDPGEIRVRVDDCITFRLSSENMVKKALYTYGPLIGVLDSSSFHSYDSGVLTNCVFHRLNHAILIVGYGRDEETKKDYWVIKNSWGKWGEEGYGRLERGVNTCGILTTYIATSIIH